MVSIEDVKYIAELCKLKFNDGELESFTYEFKEILNYVDQLKEVDTEGVKPTYFVNSNSQPLREDRVEEGLSKEDAIKNAPEEQYGYFKLLNVME
ncbi:Asp-tRNA(Asn)/Glu-tRNA(Gln) amidotransferase subunit GatC [Clostridium sp. Cult3]|uniref:Asp-tRNA(Asn)/Glu-tRNA(Gln) amidotransferase subunit GatC n=1 Tax=Clostridium sp. Cult3 TaxID=2079004 RepID=UPI001F030A3A|nr:Asp-tRNA(Asn)/Glu-tRNA(Gln) amidotransferase GatCAB subunit C [Clostridium sp. Cult3]